MQHFHFLHRCGWRAGVMVRLPAVGCCPIALPLPWRCPGMFYFFPFAWLLTVPGGWCGWLGCLLCMLYNHSDSSCMVGSLAGSYSLDTSSKQSHDRSVAAGGRVCLLSWGALLTIVIHFGSTNFPEYKVSGLLCRKILVMRGGNEHHMAEVFCLLRE
jgi:hypothetical protein